MPSRRSTTCAAAVLLALVLGFVALGLWSTFSRSTIPWALDGVVTQIDIRPEKHPGVDDAWYVTVDDRARRWDAAIAETLQVGDRVTKEPWDSNMRVNSDLIDLTLSRDTRGMIVIGPLTLAAAVGLALLPQRSPLPHPARPRNRRPPGDHGARI